MRSDAEQVVTFVRTVRLEDVPEEVVQDARLRFLDTLGVSLAGLTLDFAEGVVAVAAEQGGKPESTALGTATRLPAVWAAFVNASLAHGPDFDDTHSTAVVHPSCFVVTTALAMGERQGASGRDVLIAALAGWEVALAIGAAAPQQFHARGFHSTGIVAPFGAAMIAGRLLGLSERQLTMALGICGSMSAGLLEGLVEGAWVKRIHPGLGAHNGILAALLAARGFSGPTRVFEGHFGLYRAHLGDDVAIAPVAETLGTHWRTPMTTYKPYPSGAWNHASMDLAARLRAVHAIQPEEIEEVVCYVPPEAMALVGEPRALKIAPRSAYHARFSLPWGVALILQYGQAGLAEYDEQHLHDPALRGLAARVQTVADPALRYEGFPARMRLTLTDGRVYHDEMPIQRGTPGNPMSAGEIREKFARNAALVLSRDSSAELADAVEHLETLPDLGPVIRPLTQLRRA